MAYELVVKFRHSFDVLLDGDLKWHEDVSEFRVQFLNREAAERAMSEVELSVRPCRDENEGIAPVVIGEVIRDQPAIGPGHQQ